MNRHLRALESFISECERLAGRLRTNSDDEDSVDSLANELRAEARRAANALRDLRKQLETAGVKL